MLSLAGGHFTSNGLERDYPSRVCLSIAGNGLDEQHKDTIIVYRDISIYADGPGDLHSHEQRRTMGYAQYYYDQLKPIWEANKHRAHYFTITNELGGSNAEHIQDHIAFEENICQLAHADGLKCVVGKLAGDSPHWGTGLWQQYYAPHIIQMWNEYGALYARHVYGGDLMRDGKPTNDSPGNPERPFWEVEHLRTLNYTGGIILAECGLDGGYGLTRYHRFRDQILEYEQALKPHADMIIGLCWWECGETGWKADYTQHLKDIESELDKSFPRWESGQGGQPPVKPKIVICKKPQITNMTEEENKQVADWSFANYGRTTTHSTDDMFRMLEGGNSDSYAVLWWAERQRDVEQMLIDHGYDILYMPEEPNNPLFGLKLGYLFSYRYADNYEGGRFNDPRSYGNKKHEGLDADVIGGQADNVVNVLCTYDGIVERSLDSTGGYGKYVRVQHKRNGSVFYTRYCHLDIRSVNVGDTIKKGDPVGEVGSTGNVTGEHVHLNLEVPGYGLSGYVVADVVDPYPYLPSDNMELPPLVPPPPSGETIDTYNYFVPAGNHGIYLVMKTGNSTQPMQLEKRPSDVILRKGDGNWIDGVKYQDSEQWKVTDTAVLKGVDTSDQANGGRDAYDLNWAQWIPRHVTVGHTYHSTPTVRRFDRTNCQTISTSQANDYLYIKEVVENWQSPANTEINLTDVLVIEWRSGTSDLNIPPTETYYFCKNFGYVGWGDHFVQELPQGRQPLSGKLDCGL